MITTLDALLVRHRRRVLAYGLVLAGALMAAAALGVPGIGAGLLVVCAVLTVLALVMESTPGNRSDRLAVSPHTFATPLAGSLTVAGLVHIALVAACFALGVREPGIRAPWLVLLATLAAPAVRFGHGVWHGRGVTITAAGLRVAKMSGTVTLPWQALAAEQPAQDPDTAGNGMIVLALDRPGLLTTTGWPVSPDRIGFSHTGRDFLAATIRYYLAHPQDRTAIGTAAGYRRLRKNIRREPDVRRPPAPPRPVRWIVRTAAAGVLLTVTSLAVFAWTDTVLAGHHLLDELTQLLVPAQLTGLGLVVAALAAAYRRSHPLPPPPDADAPAPVAGPDWSRDVTRL